MKYCKSSTRRLQTFWSPKVTRKQVKKCQIKIGHISGLKNNNFITKVITAIAIRITLKSYKKVTKSYKKLQNVTKSNEKLAKVILNLSKTYK